MTSPTITREQRLAEIKARCDAATPGKWSTGINRDGKRMAVLLKEDGSQICTTDFIGFGTWANGEFIANAKPDIAWLMERVEVLEARERELLSEIIPVEYEDIRKAVDLLEELNKSGALTYSQHCILFDIFNWLLSTQEWAEYDCRQARKWARRWKRTAKEHLRLTRIADQSQSYYESNLIDLAEQYDAHQARITALENAARSCATCLYHVPDLEPVPEYCHKHCRDEAIRHKGWVFNEARFTKGEKMHD